MIFSWMKGRGSMAKSLLMILVSISLANGGQICLKLGMNRVGRISAASISNPLETILKIINTPLVLIGLILYALAAIAWLVVLSRVNLSFAYPLLGISYVIILVLSKVILHEQVSPLRWLGAVVIAIGVVVITRT